MERNDMKRVLSMMTLALLLCPAVFAQDVSAKREVAEKAARSWLALVDQGAYGSSWQQASSFFRSKVSQADWEKALQQVRVPLGAAGSRTQMGSIYQTDVPNAPKGEYVVLQYKTEMASGGSVIETVTPMLDKDGKWRVSGYFVKPAQ